MDMHKLGSILLLIISHENFAAAEPLVLKKIDVAKYPKALCLDGSPGAFYINVTASASSKDKWFVYHNGGGWCAIDVPFTQGSTVDHCYNRSFGALGTSTVYPPTLPMPGDAYSDDPSRNPMMHDWNKVQMVYCDGGSFSGRREDTVQILDRQLHFRGNFILEAIIGTLLEEYGLLSASDVVVSGGSAGGLATYLHTDQWRQAIPSTAFVAAMPDGGFFLDWDATKPSTSAHSYSHELRQNFLDFNASGGVNQGCIATHSLAAGDTADCFFAEHTVPFIQTPLFALQSVVDSWQLGEELGDSADPTLVNTYRNATTRRVLELLTTHPRHGGFIDSCVHHCGMWDVLIIDGTRMADAFTSWYTAQRQAWVARAIAAPSKVWWQARPFPCKECCGSGRVPLQDEIAAATVAQTEEAVADTFQV